MNTLFLLAFIIAVILLCAWLGRGADAAAQRVSQLPESPSMVEGGLSNPCPHHDRPQWCEYLEVA